MFCQEATALRIDNDFSEKSDIEDFILDGYYGTLSQGVRDSLVAEAMSLSRQELMSQVDALLSERTCYRVA